jgi:hypothetical protein
MGNPEPSPKPEHHSGMDAVQRVKVGRLSWGVGYTLLYDGIRYTLLPFEKMGKT